MNQSEIARSKMKWFFDDDYARYIWESILLIADAALIIGTSHIQEPESKRILNNLTAYIPYAVTMYLGWKSIICETTFKFIYDGRIIVESDDDEPTRGFGTNVPLSYLLLLVMHLSI